MQPDPADPNPAEAGNAAPAAGTHDATELEAALRATPQDPALHARAAAHYEHGGDRLAAAAHRIAEDTLTRRASGDTGASLAPLCDVATGYFMQGSLERARFWYLLVLQLAPAMAVALLNLAAIEEQLGATDGSGAARAQRLRAQAFRLQRVFVESPPAPVRSLLILSTGGPAGNVPLDTLLSHGRSTRIKYVLDHARPEEDTALPPHDLVFNAIGDPDVAAPLSARLAEFTAQCGRPLLNTPAAVAGTRRDALPARLAGTAGLGTAHCVRLDSGRAVAPAARAALDTFGLELPILLRPVGSHGGAGPVRCDRLSAVANALAGIDGAVYLTRLIDTRSDDGYFRKYRVIVVGGEILPYHLAISPHWMVHWFSAGMPGHAWKLAEEARFLEDPAAVLGTPAWQALHTAADRLGLDYCGIDFCQQADGQLLVFDASTTMLVHRERAGGPLGYRNVPVQRIVDAFEALQAQVTPGPGGAA